MEREVQERFARIEADLEATAKTLSATAQSQLRLQETLGGLTTSIGNYVDAANAGMENVREAIARYTDASNERMKRMEANLDALIRAITAEHGNRRSRQ